MGSPQTVFLIHFLLRNKNERKVRSIPFHCCSAVGTARTSPETSPIITRLYFHVKVKTTRQGMECGGMDRLQCRAPGWWNRVDQAAFVKGSLRSKSVIWVGAGDRARTKCPVSFPSARPTLASVCTFPHLMAQGHTASRRRSRNWNTGCDIKALTLYYIRVLCEGAARETGSCFVLFFFSKEGNQKLVEYFWKRVRALFNNNILISPPWQTLCGGKRM